MAVPRFLPAPTSPKTVKISTILELPGAVFYGDAINDQDLLQRICADYESTDDHRTLRHELTREGFGHDEISEAIWNPRTVTDCTYGRPPAA